MRRYTMTVVGIALAALAGVIALGSIDAVAAPSFQVKDFSCDGSTVDVDIAGLGNQNVCVEGTVNVTSDCACANNGGNCPKDANKQTIAVAVQTSVSLEPKNGRVRTTVGTTLDEICQDNLSCPGNQQAVTVNTSAAANWTLCTTDAAAGQNCTCEPGQGQVLATADGEGCTLEGEVFAGKRNSCADLFD